MMRGVLEALAIELRVRGDLDVKEAFIDGERIRVCHVGLIFSQEDKRLYRTLR
jgi:hypothetical protein